MAFAVPIPDGWFAVRNPNYPQDNLFEDAMRRATISEALGVDAFFSPLAEDGRMKVRYVLFDNAKWHGPDQCETWVRDHRDALKWQTPGGTPRVLTREKTVEAAVVKAFGPNPTERDLGRINSYALEPLNAEDVYVRRMHLCNNQVDRSFERFTERNLRQITKSIVGKSVMLGHDYRGAPQGRFFDASVEKTDGVAHAVPEFYVVRAAPSAAEAIAQIDGGVWKDVSVGFNYEAMQCDLCGGDYLDFNACQHLAGEAYPKDQLADFDRGGFEPVHDGKDVVATANYGTGQVEGLEGSFVWLGCQYDAEVVKAHRKLYGDPHDAKRAEAERAGWVPGRKSISIPQRQTEEFPPASEAPAPLPAKEGDEMDEVKLAEMETAHEASKVALAEAQSALAAVEERLKGAETERDGALAAVKTLRAAAEAEVAWYAQQLKLDDVLTALAGESGLAGLTAEKLLELRESWREKYEATLPPRMQSEHVIGAPEANPDGNGREPQPITDPRALRAAQM